MALRRGNLDDNLVSLTGLIMCIIVYDKGYGFADDKGFQSYPIELSLGIFACINLKIIAAQRGLKNKEENNCVGSGH